MKATLVLLLMALASLSACDNTQLQAPMTISGIEEVPEEWKPEQAQRDEQKTQYLKQHQVAYAWFSKFAFSQSDGVALIPFKLLPLLAPELWGSKDNFLEVVGLFNDPAMPNYPVPLGIGISALSQTEPAAHIDYTSFTCAACHVGRVRLDDGTLKSIIGGVNTEFNIVQYRVRAYQTLQAIFNGETNADKKKSLILNAFSNALVKIENTDPHYFYNNYQAGNIVFDAQYEAAQIALFKQDAANILAKFSVDIENQYTSYGALLDKNYAGFKAQGIAGLPGMADATGISTTNAYSALQESIFTSWFAQFILPPAPGMTDFMSVWQQDKRKASWDKDHKTLINGGGQWNGNIPIPMYRNLAAQLTLGLKDNDIRVAAFGVELLDGLPPTVYPFDVDIKLAKQGRELFLDNCAQCHQPHNGKVYDNLGTNLDRSFVVNWLVRKGGISSFYDVCSPDTSVMMNGEEKRPCAEYDGMSLKGKKDLIMSPNDRHHGYSARPLSGIWAQAPYLHNGSVPTLYHLLIPSERPAKFIKSRLDYDAKNVGYAWDGKGILGKGKPGEGYEFDTTAFKTLSNKGHDKNLQEGSNHYKLNWQDDRQGAMAIIEYLKTL
jgi:mono/diheme cytochrome c family protein